MKFNATILIAASVMLLSCPASIANEPNDSPLTNTASSSSLQEGPLLGLRKELYNSIQEAKEEGIGIKPYLKAFKKIESSVNKDISNKQLESNIKRIMRSLQAQRASAKHLKSWKPKRTEVSEEPKSIDSPEEEEKLTDSSLTEPQKQLIWKKYITAVQKRIKKAWFPKKNFRSLETLVKFEVKKDGRVNNLRILESSGNSEMDRIALKTVTNAAPFAPWPIKPKDNKVEIEFTFAYNVWKRGFKI